MIIYYGIKIPAKNNEPSYISDISTCKDAVWVNFFLYSAHNKPIGEAIKAYEAIGYKRVKLDVRELKDKSKMQQRYTRIKLVAKYPVFHNNLERMYEIMMECEAYSVKTSKKDVVRSIEKYIAAYDKEQMK